MSQRQPGNVEDFSSLLGQSAKEAAAAYESWLAARDGSARKGAGVYFTPPALVDHVLDLVLAGEGLLKETHSPSDFKVLDLSVGVSRFLEPMQQRLADFYEISADAASDSLYGTDIDEQSLEISQRLLGANAHLQLADGLLADFATIFPEVFDREQPGFDLVIGNPPFLNRVELRTKGAAARTRELKAAYSDVWASYTNAATLFLVQSMRLAREGGIVAMVQPESLLSARDAAQARNWISQHSQLKHLWISRQQVFGAAVRTVVPVFVKATNVQASESHEVSRSVGLPAEVWPDVLAPRDGEWGVLAGDVYGIPLLSPLKTAGTIGEIAEVSAGFLQEYYLLAPHIEEAGPGAKVATSGMIRNFEVAWGKRPTRISKRRFERPTAELKQLGAEAQHRWAVRTSSEPKLLVATQTRVLEVAADVRGEFVASVPLLSAIPKAEVSLEQLEVLFTAPALSALAAMRSVGAGLAGGVIKLSAQQVRDLPLPANREIWDAAAQRFARWRSGSREPDELEEIAKEMNQSYGLAPAAALDWWLAARSPR